MKFDENLRNLRKEKDYSQEYLAEKLGVTRQTISKWENGTAMPDLKKLIELAEFFEVSMDTLLGMDYGTDDNRQNNTAQSNTENIHAANQYTNNLIRRMNQQNHTNVKWLSIILTIISIALIISIFTSISSINNLVARIGGLENTVNYLQSIVNNSSDKSVYDDDDEDYYDVVFDSVKIDPEKPYIIQAQLKYAPSSYPKNSKIYYLVPTKDGGVNRVETEDNNGEFIAETEYDLTLDKPIYFVLDDGENIVKQEFDFLISDIFGSVEDYDLSYFVDRNKKGEYEFKNDVESVYSEMAFGWNNTDFAKFVSADMIVIADGKEAYRNELKKMETDTQNEDSYVALSLPDFTIQLDNPKQIAVYVEVKLDNGVKCRNYIELSSLLTENDFEVIVDSDYIDYLFSVGDKIITVKNSKYN